MIAITLVAGAAVFGFVSGQAVQSVGAVGNSANEKESIAYAFISASTNATVYVYNYGPVTDPSCPNTSPACLVVEGINVVENLPTAGSVSCSPISPTNVNQYSIKPFILTCNSNSFSPGGTYTFVVVGKYGSSAQYTVKA